MHADEIIGLLNPIDLVIGGGWTNERLEVGRVAACASSGAGHPEFLPVFPPQYAGLENSMDRRA